MTLNALRHRISSSSAWFKRSVISKTMASFAAASSSSSSGSGHHGNHSNRLSLEKSPYLLQHAANPVDWYPWGADAFQKAKKDDKLIFLSIGYSTCHWCHVMERESFESVDIGQFLNDNYVSIKVDREERPDVDKVYMTFVQATTGAGGWPLSVWLTPDLKPIFGGTYFPPDDRYFNRPGFKTMLEVIAEQWKKNRAKLESQGTKILDVLVKGVHASDSQSQSTPTTDCIRKCYNMLEGSFNEDHGGFGKAPKFPQPVNFNMLLRYFKMNPDTDEGARALHMCLFTLTKIAEGGIHDHVSQGFHRYSTDEVWHVPHFEKMLYDQGQLAVAFAEAYQITQDSFYADIARDIYQYVNRDLSHPMGGFYSAEDADSLPNASSQEKKEGAFCVWEFDELRALLGGNIPGTSEVSMADVFCHFYGAKPDGNVNPLQDPHDELKQKNVLTTSATLEETASKFKISTDDVESCLDKCRKILHETRQSRPKPHLDDKMVSAWNGLMLSGFAKGGQALQDAKLVDRAIRAATFLRTHLFDPLSGTLLRSCYTTASKDVAQISPPIEGFLDDYSSLIRGLLDLYEGCHDDGWLAWADQLQSSQNKLFWDNEDGAFYSSREGDASIIMRIKDDQDGAEPSPNSVSASNLLRLSAMLGKPEYTEMAERIFRVFSKQIEKIPQAVPELISALSFHLATPKQIIIIGDKDSDDTKALLTTIHKQFLPNKVLIVTDGKPDTFVCQHVEIIKSLTKIDEKATAYFCENFTCKLPVNSAEDLEKQLTV